MGIRERILLGQLRVYKDQSVDSSWFSFKIIELNFDCYQLKYIFDNSLRLTQISSNL